MSLWTPGGEHEVPRPTDAPSNDTTADTPGEARHEDRGRPLPVGVDPAMI